MADPKERLEEEMRAALKSGEKVRLGALRMLSAAVKNREVEVGRDLSEEEFADVAGREVKRRKEAAEAYENAGRRELVDREREEQAVLESYAPEQLSDSEIEALIDQAIRETGASGPSDMGKVMGHVMERAKGRADGKVVGGLVRTRLQTLGV